MLKLVPFFALALSCAGARAATPQAPFDGLWTAHACDSMKTTATCGRIDLDLVERDGRLCGRYAVAESGGVVTWVEPSSPSVAGRRVGDVAYVVLRDHGAARLVELRRAGSALDAREQGATGGRAIAWSHAFSPSREAASVGPRMEMLRDACEAGAVSIDATDAAADVDRALQVDITSVPFEACMAHAGASLGMPRCYAGERARLQRRHDDLVADIRARYATTTSLEGQDVAASRRAFDTAQAQWVVYRDSDCRSRDELFGLGNARALDEDACLIDHLTRRILDLEALREQFAIE